MLPVLLLVALGLMLSKSKPMLALEKTEVVSLASVGKDYQFSEPDTQVKVIVKATPSLYQRFVKRSWGYDEQNQIINSMFLVNEKRWKSTPHFQGIRNVKYLGRDRYSMEFVFPLRDVPQSVGRVTLKAIIKADNGLTLPISITMRDKT